MRKFKLLFVVLVASIFFMPSELFAQREKYPKIRERQQMYIQRLRNMQKGYDEMKQNLEKKKDDPMYVQVAKQTLAEQEKEIKELEQALIANGINLNSPANLGEQIIETIKNRNATFSEEENLTNTLLSMDKSDERKEALLKVYNYLNTVANMYFDAAEAELGRPGHKGTERGDKEIALAEQIKKRMNDEGDKTFGLLSGQREDDIVVRTADERVLGAGTKIKRKNGVLTVNNDGGMTLTMNDGTVFNGYFKEQVNFYGDSNQYSHFENIADAKLLLAEEFTPYQGDIKYANGTTDKLISGKSVTAQLKAAKEELEAAMKTSKAEFAKLSQKYGAPINNIKSTGKVNVGYSITMLDEYIKVYNKYKSARIKAENGQDDPLGLRYYQPTVSEAITYGKTAKRVKLGGTIFANEIVVGEFMVVNGKIAAIFRQPYILAVKDL